MSFCCYAGDYDPADLVNEQERRAAKQHRCCECGIKIEPGDMYQYTTMLAEGNWMDFHTCEKCADLRESLSEVTCVLYEGLEEAFTDWLREGPGTAMSVKEGSHAARLVPSYYIDDEDDDDEMD